MKIFKPLLFIIILSISSYSFAQYEKKIHSEEVCKGIYQAISTFIYLADAEWKKENEEKALLYSSAASNYATIYSTICEK